MSKKGFASTAFPSKFVIIILCLCVLVVSGCGPSLYTMASILLNKKDKEPLPLVTNSPPGVSIVPFTGNQSADVFIIYRLFDGNSDTLTIQVEYSPNAGGSFFPATESSNPISEGTAGLSASPGGMTHIFVWDSAADLGPVVNNQVQIRIIPYDTETGTPWITPGFTVDNNALPTVTVTTPAGTQSGSIPISYQVADPESDAVSVTVEYSTDGGTSYLTATEGSGGDGVTGLASSPGGTAHIFVWKSLDDLGFVGDTAVRIRITPTDTKEGVSGETLDFTANNNQAPIAEVNTPAGEQSRDITIVFRLRDSDSDLIDITVEYSTDDVSWFAATPGAGSEPLTGLSSSPAGMTHIFIWDSLTDLGQAFFPSVKVRITPADPTVGSPAATNNFAVANNQAPVVFVQTPTGVQTGDITITYVLLDNESNLCSIAVKYSDDGGLNFYDATMGSGGDGTTTLASLPTGVVHTYVWDLDTDLPSARSSLVQIRIIPNDGAREGLAGTTASFQIDMTVAPSVSIVTPSGVQSGNVSIDYTLTDAESDTVSITVEYTIDGWATSATATKASGGDPITGLTSSATGILHTFIWDTITDLGSTMYPAVQVRITPSDTNVGAPDTTGDFVLGNNDSPIASVVTPPVEQSGNVTIDYILYDVNSDLIDTVVKYSTDSGTTWSVADAIEVPGPPSEGITSLTSSPTGIAHIFVWDSLTDLGLIYCGQVRILITPSDALPGSPGETNDFAVSNNDAPSVAVLTPSGVQSATVSISYVLTEPESENCDIAVEFSENGGGAWSPATMGSGGDGTTNLAGSPGGTGHSYVWDSTADIAAPDAWQSDIRVRITPYDPYRSGFSGQTGNFEVDNTQPPSVTVTNPGSPGSGSISIDYTLFDVDSQICSVVVEASAGAGWFVPTQSGGDPTTGLASSPGGISHAFVWNSFTDNIGMGALENADFRITPSDTKPGSPDTVSFSVDNTAGIPWVEVTTPAGEQTGNVTINYTLYDVASDLIDSYFQYSTDGGGTWTDATGSPILGETSSPGGDPHTFIWDSVADIGAVYYTTVKIRIQPDDGVVSGSWVSTGAFTVNNNDAPWGIVATPVGPVSGDVTVSYDLHDNESDFCSIYVEFSEDGGSTFSGPATAGPGGDGITGLSSTPGGTGHTFVWNSALDLGVTWQTDIQIRITPSDPYRAGTEDATADFEVDNTSMCVWNGTVDTDWFNGANWTGGVPGSGNVTLIPAGQPRYPVTNSNVTVNSLTVEAGASLTIGAGVTFKLNSYATINGTVFINSGAGSCILDINNNLTVSATGRIDGDSFGYPGAAGPGVGNDDPVTDAGADGGGHGGFGGAGWNNGPGGISYGDFLCPVTPGSGGGQGHFGGGAMPGGAAFKIEVKTLTLDGVISVNGGGPSTEWDAGGGAGGSIWIECRTLQGTGYCRANGGGGNDYGGGGAGGRIAIYCDYAVSTYANHGTCSASGGPKDFGSGSDGACGSCVFVDNKGNADPADDDIHIYGDCRITQASVDCLNMELHGSAKFFLDSHAAGNSQVVLNVAGDLTVPVGCTITADYLGHVNGQGPGPGLLAGAADEGGGGGGHGGDGGDGDKNGGSKGLKYDNEFAPSWPGSGGGDDFDGIPGGFGGGAMKLITGGTFTNNGEVRADGQDASSASSGGGAGGSIWLECDFLAGSGLFVAYGGNSTNTAGGGGGGAGGRISLDCVDSTGWSGTATAAKGLGKNDGQNGTVNGP